MQHKFINYTFVPSNFKTSKMTTENLKAFFQLSIDESIDLENISVVNTPTKDEFFEVLPYYYEPSIKLEKDGIELSVYFAFDWIYVIDDNGVTYKFKTMEGVENLFSNLVNESEIEYNNKRESLEDLIKYLNGK